MSEALDELREAVRRLMDDGDDWLVPDDAATLARDIAAALERVMDLLDAKPAPRFSTDRDVRYANGWDDGWDAADSSFRAALRSALTGENPHA